MARNQQAEDGLLLRYLLGNLPEDQQEAVEDRAFSDGEFLTALQAVETDLIDSYVRGELPASQRKDFEGRFLASPQRRAKVEFARSLVRVADQESAKSPAKESSSPFALFQLWAPMPQWALGTAALVLTAAVSWLVLENRGIKSDLAALQAERSDLAQQAEALRRQLAEQKTTQGKSEPVLLASLTLPPGNSRSEARGNRLSLAPGAQLARIELQLEPMDDYPRYRAELRTTAGVEVLAASNLPKRSVAGGIALTFDVPANLLLDARYELTLKGQPGGGSMRDIGYYYLDVQRQ